MTSLLFIGPLTQDIIRIEERSSRRIGGSVYYAGEACRAFSHTVTIVPLISHDTKNLLREIHRKITVKPIHVANAFSFENIYEQGNVFRRQQNILRPIGQGKGISIEDLRALDIENAGAIFLGPQSPADVPLEAMQYMYAKNKNICLYAQGFFRSFSNERVNESHWDKASEYLKETSRLILSEQQLYALTQHTVMEQALREVAQYGPQEIIVSRGQEGFLIYSQGEVMSFQYPPLVGFINPNGVTSTFAGIYLATRTEGKTPSEAGEYALHAATLKMMSWLPLRKGSKRIEEIIRLRKVLAGKFPVRLPAHHTRQHPPIGMDQCPPQTSCHGKKKM